MSAGTLIADGANALADTSAVTVAGGAALNLQMSGTKTVGALTGGGTIAMNGAQLVAGAGNASSTFSGALSGTARLRQDRHRHADPTGASRLHRDHLVSGGTLNLTGSLASGVTVLNGATLVGTGTVGQSVQVASGGTLAGCSPPASPWAG